MQFAPLPLFTRQHPQQNILTLVEQVQARHARKAQTLHFTPGPRERAVGGYEVRISDDLRIRQSHAVLLFGQTPVML